MADAAEIVRLFSTLASALRQAPDNMEAAGEAEAAVTSLAASLNPPPAGTRVLDAALSLMCFTAPEVWSWNVKFLVEAIVTALSSSISCKVMHIECKDKKMKEELIVGSSINYDDAHWLIKTCLNALLSLEDCGLSHLLFRTVTKVAISASRFQRQLLHSSLFSKTLEQLDGGRRSLGSTLYPCLPMETCIDDHEVPLRLCMWYLDAMILKTDILGILKEYTQRPFLHLKTELHEKMAWRAIVRCLATSPIMFMEARRLLQNWFLMTGLVSVLDLQVALVWSILDVLSRPMWWDFSMDIGLWLPFSHVYFLSKHRELLHILNGPVSCKLFLDLVQHIQADRTDLTSGITEQNKAKTSFIDSNSTWALLMNFPQWTYFAIMLCFCKDGPYPEALISKAVKSKLENYPEICHAAKIYLSFIFSPLDPSHRMDIGNHISNLTWPSTAQCTPYYASQQISQRDSRTFFCSTKLRKPRSSSRSGSAMTGSGGNATDVRVWLQQFHSNFVKFCDTEAAGKNLLKMPPCQLISKLPLGMLLSNPSGLDEEGCHLLLHYAATGTILQVDEMLTIVMKSSCSSENIYNGSAGIVNATEWSSGASVVFDLFDVVEDITSAFFDSESTQVDYICQIKSKVVKYLLKCVTYISEACKDLRQEVTMLSDLHNRMLMWKQLGQEDFEGCKYLDDILNNLGSRSSH